MSNQSDQLWLLAFVVTPLVVVAIGWAVVFFEERRPLPEDRKRHPTK